MSRYAIDTIQSRKPSVIIKVVFFGYNYKPTWMTTSKGGPTVPNRILDRVVVEQLEAEGTLDESIFNEYVTRAEQRMIEKLIQNGKADNAYERAHLQMTDIYNALRAIIVADKLTGTLRVQCLNKDKSIVTYNPVTQIVDLEGLSWNVAAEFVTKAANGPTTDDGQQHSAGGNSETTTTIIGQGHTTADDSGTTTVVDGQQKSTDGQTQNTGGNKQRITSGGTKRVFGDSGHSRSDDGKTEQTTRRGTVRTLGTSSSGREMSALQPKSPRVRWWTKYRFAVLSFVFFFLLSSAIVFGLLKLQKSIEGLPDKTDQAQPTLQQPTPADSLKQRADSLKNTQPKNSSQRPSATPQLPQKRVTFGA